MALSHLKASLGQKVLPEVILLEGTGLATAFLCLPPHMLYQNTPAVSLCLNSVQAVVALYRSVSWLALSPP